MKEGRDVLLFVVDAGGGHRAAANALRAAGQATGAPLRFQVANIQDVLAPLDLPRRLTGASLEETYNGMVRRGWTRHLVPLLRAFQWTIRRLHRGLVDRIAADLAARRPEVVVSLFPNFNAVLRDATRAALPGVPFVVVLTDLADFPPHFWMEPGFDRVVVATARAAAQARALGYDEGRIVRASGTPLHPRFYPAAGAGRRSRARAALGLDGEDFLVLLLFGGKGAPEMHGLAQALLRAHPGWHVVAVCGQNPGLLARMEALAATDGGRLRPLGFTDEVSELMAAADVLVTKPGPGCLAEAFHQRVPTVVTANARTIPQERYNATFLEEEGLGLVVKDWRQVPDAVGTLFGWPTRRAEIRARLRARPENRAVYEVLELLASPALRPGPPSP
ncbi:MAG TPA: glycosyltransferase [Vicinamibacteria bacterium]|nr:glycosyltransferase [Vicinamibacteria bacterium]